MAPRAIAGTTIAAVGAATALLAGCAAVQPRTVSAAAEIRNASGQLVGRAVLTEIEQGVRVAVDARGLPAGDKGVHIHAVGACEGPTFESAGPHFNPDGKQHGILNPAGAHAGDLPNIRIDATGTGRLETMATRITLGSGPHSVFDGDGSALVIHASADDHRTDPTGNSGNRIACGVIVKR
jgi:Cu-Zn family superoxide dismutase